MTRHRPGAARVRRLFRSLYLWHRYIGLSVALLVVVLAISGILLNHAGGLALKHRYVRDVWLLDWYGIRAPMPETGWSLPGGNTPVGLLGDRLFIGTTLTGTELPDLRGALTMPEFIVAASSDSLLLLSPQGEQLDRVDHLAGLPDGEVRRIGLSGGRLAARIGAAGYLADDDLLNWQPLPGGSRVAWSEARALPDSLVERLRQGYREHMLDWERVLLDLHSGRILGRGGVWLMDAAAVMLLLLAMSGTAVWLRQKAKRRAQRRATARS